MKQMPLVIIFLLIPLFGCASIDESELYGHYIIEFPFGSEELILYENGTYKQIIKIKNKKDSIFEYTNTWKYDNEYDNIALNEGLLLTKGFCEFNDEYKIPFKGRVLCGIIKYTPFESIRLSAGCETVFYTKVK